MDADTAVAVAWIGVLGGLIGGGVVASTQYLLHRQGSRLKWWDDLRDEAADLLASVLEVSVLSGAGKRWEDGLVKSAREMNARLNHLLLLAPKPVTDAAQDLAAKATPSGEVDETALAAARRHFVAATRAELKVRIR